jgi:hypothetical protein
VVCGGSLCGEPFLAGTIHEEDIEPIILVEIKERHAAAGGLKDELLGLLSPDDGLCRQAAPLGDIDVVGQIGFCLRDPF